MKTVTSDIFQTEKVKMAQFHGAILTRNVQIQSIFGDMKKISRHFVSKEFQTVLHTNLLTGG